MEIEEAIAKVDNYISNLDRELFAIGEELATNAISLIVNRIQKKGIGKEYSKKKVPAYLLLLGEDKLDTEQTRQAIRRRAKSDDPEENMVNWATVREAHGNQTDFVDLTFTGQMLMGVIIIATEKRGDRYVTIVGGKDKEVRQKIEWNTLRYGPFLIVTPDEKQMLERLLITRMIGLNKKYLGYE